MRIGRGMGTGKGGHTATRGMKGQKSRSGYKAPRQGFEGGQMPLSRRLPTLRGISKKSRGRGFIESRTNHYTLQLSEVAAKLDGDVVSTESLFEAGLINARSKKLSVKIVFDQEIDRKLTIKDIPVSANVRAAVEKAGGKVE